MSEVQGYYASDGWNFLLKLYQPQLLSHIQGMGFLKTVPKLEGKSIFALASRPREAGEPTHQWPLFPTFNFIHQSIKSGHI